MKRVRCAGCRDLHPGYKLHSFEGKRYCRDCWRRKLEPHSTDEQCAACAKAGATRRCAMHPSEGMAISDKTAIAEIDGVLARLSAPRRKVKVSPGQAAARAAFARFMEEEGK